MGTGQMTVCGHGDPAPRVDRVEIDRQSSLRIDFIMDAGYMVGV